MCAELAPEETERAVDVIGEAICRNVIAAVETPPASPDARPPT